ncbi:MAG: protein kinase [Thermoanaerobaculia bacterium]
MTDLPPSPPQFEILRALGKGGTGTVYLARDLKLGRMVALKLLNQDDLSSEEHLARFAREARAAAAIRHPNVATLYEVSETPAGEPFLVMEYCEGETLSQRIRRAPMEAGEILRIARQLAAGVAAAHENGVIHRDIKSANVIIEPSGLVKILDFGLAKLLPRETSSKIQNVTFDSPSGKFLGTLHFVAPEQTLGNPVDERTDLFSLGVVLYHMGAQRLPFNGDAPLLVLERIRHSEPDPFVPLDPAFPPALAKVISRLLQKDPKDRIQSARELVRELEEIEFAAPVPTSSHSMLSRTIRRPHRMRIGLSAAALLIVIASVLLVRRAADTPSPVATAEVRTPIRSMAVLPMRNLANSSGDEFLSVGLADALVTELQQIDALQVRPTSAILQFKGREIDATQASRELKVDGILEGHFLSAGNLVRVNLQLIDARSGYNIWADSVDGRRDNLLQLIDDVAARTLNGLNQSLGTRNPTSSMSHPRSSNAQAYEQYLRARALTGSFRPEEYAEQLASLRKAIALDPGFAAAYADLAIAMSLGQTRGLIKDPKAMQKAEAYAKQAVRLDPQLPQAQLALGRVFVRFPERYRESMRAVLAAIRLESTDAHALHAVLSYLVSAGEIQKAECIGDRLVQLDPGSNEARIRGYWYVNAVDPEGALRHADAALESPDTAIAARDIRGMAYLLLERPAQAEAEADEALRLVPTSYLGKSLKAMAAAARGDRASADQWVARFADDARRNHWAAMRIAYVYGRLGDRDAAMPWVRTAAKLGHHSWYSLVKHPWLASLQADPEFQEIVAAIKADLDDVRDDVIGVYQLICR